MAEDRIVKLITEGDEPLTIDLKKTAILVVDMQNAFLSSTGYFDIKGIDIQTARRIIHPCRKLISACRENNIKIIYLKMIYNDDPSDGSLPATPAGMKSSLPSMLARHPELKDRAYIEGTWGAEIIEELKPEQGDLVIIKRRHDGFIGTELDQKLQSMGIRYLIFIGTATNICIESTLRHAFFLDYFAILVPDCAIQMGPELTQQAAILNVQSTFGWLAGSESLLHAMNKI
jgi:ureidoacrylate peracid hydrolase